MDFKGLNLTRPINRLPAGEAAQAVNCRSYGRGFFGLRSLLTNAIIAVSGIINSLARLNDTTPAGPVSGFTIISANTVGLLFNNATQIAMGLSGNPVSMVPFRPNASVQPWEYIGDNAPQDQVSITTKFLISGTPTTFACTGQVKVRSDGLIYKTGIKEPQVAPTVVSETVVVNGSVTVLATTLPWQQTGTNPTNYPFTVTGGTPPIAILAAAGTTIQVTVAAPSTTIKTSYNATALASDFGPVASGSPGFNVSGSFCNVLMGAFTDNAGNVVTPSVGTGPVTVGVGPTTFLVPVGATQLQLGIDDTAYGSNTGSFVVNYSVTTQAESSNVSILGNMTLYYWGDSPHTGPVAEYIWKNPTDGGSGTSRTISTAVGSVNGTSITFDFFVGGGSPSTPMQWMTLDSSGNVVGQFPIFSSSIDTPASDGFADFNFCLIGTIFIPAAGTYTFTLNSKDGCIWGIGGGATWPGKGTLNGYVGQKITVVNKIDLLPNVPLNGGIEAEPNSVTVAVTFPAAGDYSIELDYDYWHNTPRGLWLTCSQNATISNNLIPPLAQNSLSNSQYWYKYRSSATGAQSNPSPASLINTNPAQVNTITSAWSNDPQVDKVDYYRQDDGLANPTYVATGPNDGLGGTIGGVIFNTPIDDSLSDLAAAGNQIMEFDDFEPVPSIDLPRSGILTVGGGGAIVRVSGDFFNIRWLPGTVIEIGSPTQLAYSFVIRPTSTTTMTIPMVPSGTNLVWNIAEPILAAQPLAYLFGPTDNINFTFGVGDPNRPGTMYWCKGSNLDSWPDTNQLDVTDPSEALVNGAMSGGLGVVFSIKRAWVIQPNFFNATAEVTGTTGSTWSLQDTSITRGLFIPRCLIVEGGGNIFFRVDDGIHVSPAGHGSKSITDETLFGLFSHEGSTPVSVVRAGITIFPPNDALPQSQKFAEVNGYMYWDYLGLDNNPHSLVFDIGSMAWVWDLYDVAITSRSADEGISTQGVLVGCVDGTIRQMVSAGSSSETAIATVMSAAMGGVGWMHTRLITVEYSSNAAITLSFVCPDASTNGSIAPATITLPSTSGTVTKWKTVPSFNKWKLLQCIFTFTDPTAQIYMDGLAFEVKAWGSNAGYEPMNPFNESGGFGGQP